VERSAVVFNPKSHPVAICDDGTAIGGLCSGDCDLEDPVVKLAVEIGHLVVVSVADPSEVTNFSVPIFADTLVVEEQQLEPAAKKRSLRKKPPEAKEN
jgi:hypothetical protein